MRTVAWLVLGTLGVAFWSAASAWLGWLHVMPDAAIVTVAFLALRREPLPLVATAAVLGYIVGRQALAPIGLHETSLVVCALAIYLAAGHLVGSGAFFFASVAGGAVVFYHLCLALLVWIGGSEVGFSSWATASLVPSALATFALAALSFVPMNRLEQLLSPRHRQELLWR